MPKTKQQKEEIVANVAEKFRKMKAAAFASISGFTMAQADDLRAKAREEGVDLFITKKTLLGLAAKEAEVEDLDPRAFEGSVLTAVSYNDEVAAARILKDFQKENEAFTFVAGVLEGKGISAEEVTQLAKLPSKQELYAKLVGSINAPVSGFVNVLAGNLRGLVTVLGAIKDKKSA